MLLAYGELAMKEIELRMTKSHLSRIDKTSQALQMLTREVAEMGNLSAASDLPQVRLAASGRFPNGSSSLTASSRTGHPRPPPGVRERRARDPADARH